MNAVDYVDKLAQDRAASARKEKNGGEDKELPDFSSGDTVNVAVRVSEGEKERIQNFKGLVISRSGSGINSSFVVRKISSGIGVERIFPLHSTIIQSIDVLSSSKARKSKLFYLRGMSERKIRRKLS